MIGFRATKEMLAKLKEIARKERRPLSNLVRMIVEDWLEDYGRTQTVRLDYDGEEASGEHESDLPYSDKNRK